jgi:hypothetical protein
MAAVEHAFRGVRDRLANLVKTGDVDRIAA